MGPLIQSFGQFEITNVSQVLRPLVLFVGEPAELVDKILAMHEIFGFSRFVIQMAIGIVAHEHVMQAIELLGTRIAPEVRKALS
jgi:alkanesulfonate monooxygenase SsuD/methylene tetrahydromethanopterin reductase-like flavin-dependent oxidoreductase (luciferase family)